VFWTEGGEAVTDNITLPRAVIEQVRSAIRGFYNKYSAEAAHEDAGRAIAALDAALEQKETFADSLVRRSWEAHRAALAEPPATPEPVAKAWAEGYQQGVQDERTSEASIGIAGFGAKVEPARQNPYAALPAPEPDAIARAVEAEREACAEVCDAEATIEGIAQRCAAAIRARGSK
jgi:hypothetical protein